MKNMQKNEVKRGHFLFLAAWVIVSFYGVLRAQGLQDRLDYLRGLQREALQAESEGKYDKSIELARKIHEESKKVDDIMGVLKRWNVLRDRVALAQQVHAYKYAKKDYDLALKYYNSSHQLMNQEKLDDAVLDIERGIVHADAAIEKSRQLFLDEANKAKKEKKNTGTLMIYPKQDTYEVRLIASRRDCLWRIAGYEFIYKNSQFWKYIYEANRDKVKNPNLIFPGQVLKIPPVEVPLKKAPK